MNKQELIEKIQDLDKIYGTSEGMEVEEVE